MPDASIIVAVVALITSLVTVLASRKRNSAEAYKYKAEADATISTATLALADRLQKEIDKLRGQHLQDLADLTLRIQQLEERNNLYRRYISMLIGQLTAANIMPIEPPEPLRDRAGD
jgi:hypothetical protein